MKITILGAGVMGTIFQKALIEKKVFNSEDVQMVDHDQETKHGDTYLLAVKPQDFEETAKRLANVKDKLIISIMTGIPIKRMEKAMPGNRIVRSMPNLGAQSFKSMSVWMAGEGLPAEEQELVEKILSAIGEELEVDNEDLLDAATAVSGSGPGYVYYFARKMMESAQELGFKEEEADKLIKQTLEGTLQAWKDSGLSANELENRVTSKGGTTEAGLNEFRENNLGQTIVNGIKKAYQRAKELSKL